MTDKQIIKRLDTIESLLRELTGHDSSSAKKQIIAKQSGISPVEFLKQKAREDRAEERRNK